jgi:hypothetical protein
MNDQRPTLGEFANKVLYYINRTHYSGGGARWPSPVSLMLFGKPTDEAVALGADAKGYHFLPDRVPLNYAEGANFDTVVMHAIKRLHQNGKIKFLERFGYTWVIPASAQPTPMDGDKWVDDPGPDAPFYWKDITL